MALPADYHMHTPLCRHATGEPADYAAQAVKIGLPEIGFADHSPMRKDDFDDWRMRFDQLDEYVEKVRATQRDYPNLTIRLGLEIDYLPGQDEWIRALMARHPWDYLIGSVHYVSESWAIDNPNQISHWRGRSPDSVWTTYLERLTAAVGSGFFDIVGHIDLPKKFGFLPKGNLAPLWEQFFITASQAGCAIELNTGGFRKDCRELYPAPALLEAMFSRGIPIAFGSDAHAPSEVGSHFNQAMELAQSVGYKASCRFQARQRVAVPLE